VYLVAGGCGIYESRPEACRVYDCREYVTNKGMPLRIRLQAAKRLSHDRTQPVQSEEQEEEETEAEVIR
jgi:Fe-S-cluster containining protein